MHPIYALCLLLVIPLALEAKHSKQSLCRNKVKNYAKLSCGETRYTNNQFVNRITRGRDAKPGEFPFLTLVARGGGIIIGNQHVLTAAHCEKLTRTTNTKIGCHKSSSCRGKKHNKAIASVFDHQEYRIDPIYKTTYYNDISLLKTFSPMNFELTNEDAGSINSICLPKRDTKYRAGEKVLAVGYGLTTTGGKGSDIPQVAEMQIVAADECKAIFKKFGKKLDMQMHICAISQIEGQSPCNGDSGGPLLRRKQDGRYELVGIVSFSAERPCNNDTPLVFTRVSSYIDWIEEHQS